MSTRLQSTGRAGEELARKRLCQYVQYGDLVAGQEAALDADDIDLFNELATELQELQQEIGLSSPVERPVFAPGSPESKEAAEVLSATIKASAGMSVRLASMRVSGAEAIRQVSGRRPHVRRYLNDSHTPGKSRFDVRF